MQINDFVLTTINEGALYPAHKRLAREGTIADWLRHVTDPALRSYLKTGPSDRTLSTTERHEIALQLRDYYTQHIAEG